MKIVIAVDSFKGSLTSLEAGHAVAEGIRRVYPDAEILVRPLADGGEGTVDALTSGMGGRLRTLPVEGPLGESVSCAYGIIGGTAVIEMAAAAGLPLVPPALRDPMNTSTYGVGQVIADAMEQGCRRFLVGIGGSATNDGGAGMLQALGFRLTDADGGDIPRGAKGLAHLAHIDAAHALPALSQCTFRVACDVTNPLCGQKGASAVFGPQKGATEHTIPLMDAYLATRSGFLLRATGDNATLVATLAKDAGKVKILGLYIANALVALSGCIMCQYQRYFDISMGTGTLVLAVASVIVGTQLLAGMRFLRATTAVVLGSILYKGCVALALSLGLSPFDLKLVTAVLLLIIIIAGGQNRKKGKRHA